MEHTYNVTLRHVTETIFAVKGNKYYIFRMCGCISRYAACNTHVPYCGLWPVRLYCIFPQRLTNGTIIGKSSFNTKCVFWFSLQLLSETFLILRRSERDVIKMYIGQEGGSVPPESVGLIGIEYTNSYISYTMVWISLFVSLALCSYKHVYLNERQHNLDVELMHQLSSSVLRKEVSGYTCCDVLVSRGICIPSRVLRMEAPLCYLYRCRICAFHLVLSHRVLQRVGCKSDIVVGVISLSSWKRGFWCKG